MTSVASLADAMMELGEKERNDLINTFHLATMDLLDAGKPYFINSTLAGALYESGILQEASQKTSDAIGAHIAIHVDAEANKYRVGMMATQKDVDETRGCVSLHDANPAMPHQVFAWAAPTKFGRRFFLNGALQPAGALTAFVGPGCHSVNAAFVAEATASGGGVPKDNEKVRKPRNAWILYRLSQYKSFKQLNPDWNTAQISKLVAAKWHSAPFEVREHFKKLAERERYEHARVNPGWKCQPRSTAEIARRRRSHVASAPVANDTALPWTFNVDANGFLVGGEAVSSTN